MIGASPPEHLQDTIRPIKQCVVHIEQILLDVLFQEERATYPEMYVRTEARHIPQPSQDSPGMRHPLPRNGHQRHPRCSVGPR
jgi:hypothetical protein